MWCDTFVVDVVDCCIIIIVIYCGDLYLLPACLLPFALLRAAFCTYTVFVIIVSML